MRRLGPFNQPFLTNNNEQDTGKDLFALLFLVMLMLVQIFMLAAYDALPKKKSKPPDASEETESRTKTKPPIGQVVKKGDKLLIRFDDHSFDPVQEGAELVTSGYTVTSKNEKGQEVQVLYINYEGIIDSKKLSQALAPLRGIGVVPMFRE